MKAIPKKILISLIFVTPYLFGMEERKRKNASVPVEYPIKKNCNSLNENLNVLLQKAVLANDLEEVKKLVNKGANPLTSIDLPIQAYEDPHSSAYNEELLLVYAIKSHSNDIAVHLYQSIFFDQIPLSEILRATIRANNITFAEFILSLYPDAMDEESKIMYESNYRELLDYAIKSNSEKIIELLLKVAPSNREQQEIYALSNFAEASAWTDEILDLSNMSNENQLSSQENLNSIYTIETEIDKDLPEDINSSCHWHKLPEEIQEYIILFLKDSDLSALSLVNKSIKNIVKNIRTKKNEIEEKSSNESIKETFRKLLDHCRNLRQDLKISYLWNAYIDALKGGNIPLAKRLYNYQSVPQYWVDNELNKCYKKIDNNSIVLIKSILNSRFEFYRSRIGRILINILSSEKLELNSNLLDLINFLLDRLDTSEIIPWEDFAFYLIKIGDKPLIDCFKKHKSSSKNIAQPLEVIRALETNDIGVFTKMLEKTKIDLDAVYPFHYKNCTLRMTLLQRAILLRNNEIARLLISKGANIFKKPEYTLTTLSLAIASQNKEMLDILLPLYQSQENPNLLLIKASSLIDSIKKGKIEEAKSLLSPQVINVQNRQGHSPFFYSIICQQLKLVEFMIKIGANVNMQDAKKWTPLFWAVSLNNIPIVELLLKNGAITNMEDDTGSTPLMYSVRNNFDDITALLISYSLE